jgi:hypothetical protein
MSRRGWLRGVLLAVLTMVTVLAVLLASNVAREHPAEAVQFLVVVLGARLSAGMLTWLVDRGVL